MKDSEKPFFGHREKTKKPRSRAGLTLLPTIDYLFKASFAWSANAVNAAASFTAKSANILRLMSISANFKPCINFE